MAVTLYKAILFLTSKVNEIMIVKSVTIYIIDIF